MESEEHSSRFWTKISGIFGQKEEKIEQAIIDAQEDGELAKEESSMLLSVLEFTSMQIHEIMTPRADMICMPIESSINTIAEKIIESGHSRIPIFTGTKDNITGIAYAKDLLPFIVYPSKHNDSITSFLRTVHFVPETKVCSELFQEFRSTKSHIAIVLDEYGGTAGLVTIEDLLEVIVGDIEDEHDLPKSKEITKIDANSYHVQGRTFLEDLAPIGLEVHSETVDTIGGYLSLLSGNVPTINEEFILEDWKITVKDADIKQVKVLLLEKIQTIPKEDI